MSTTTESVPGEVLSLFLDQNEDGQVDSSVPIRWCISPELARWIEDEDILDPQLVIVIEQSGHELKRFIVPLEQQMHYIQFSRPAENVIRATIMWSSEEGSKSVKKVLTNRNDDGEYTAALVTTGRLKTEALDDEVTEIRREERELTREEDDFEKQVGVLNARREQLVAEREASRKSEPEQACIRSRFDTLSRIDYEFQLGVIVPSEMFAKEPPRWMKWLGTRYKFWNGAAKDQCDLRRRALLTGLTLPFIAVVGLIIGALMLLIVSLFVVIVEAIDLAIITACLFVGARNINYRPVLHPFGDEEPKEIAKNLKPSFWLNKKIKHEYQPGHGHYYTYELRHPILTVVNPPVILALALVGLLLNIFLNSALTLTIGTIMAAVYATIIVVVGVLASSAIATAKAKRAKKKEQEEAADRERQKLALRKDLEQMACGSTSREVKVSALPRERRTMSLRFQAAKSTVCKPFAR